MIHFFTVTVPPNTSKNSPLKQDFTLTPAPIRRIMVRIPPGVMGLAGFQIYDGSRIILPQDIHTYITGAEEVWDLSFNYELNVTNNVISFQFYNDDNTYSHTFYITFLTGFEEEITLIPLSRLLSELREIPRE